MLEVEQATGSTYMLVADRATGSSYLWAYVAVCIVHLYVNAASAFFIIQEGMVQWVEQLLGV